MNTPVLAFTALIPLPSHCPVAWAWPHLEGSLPGSACWATWPCSVTLQVYKSRGSRTGSVGERHWGSQSHGSQQLAGMGDHPPSGGETTFSNLRAGKGSRAPAPGNHFTREPKEVTVGARTRAQGSGLPIRGSFPWTPHSGLLPWLPIHLQLLPWTPHPASCPGLCIHLGLLPWVPHLGPPPCLSFPHLSLLSGRCRHSPRWHLPSWAGMCLSHGVMSGSYLNEQCGEHRIMTQERWECLLSWGVSAPPLDSPVSSEAKLKGN